MLDEELIEFKVLENSREDIIQFELKLNYKISTDGSKNFDYEEQEKREILTNLHHGEKTIEHRNISKCQVECEKKSNDIAIQPVSYDHVNIVNNIISSKLNPEALTFVPRVSSESKLSLNESVMLKNKARKTLSQGGGAGAYWNELFLRAWCPAGAPSLAAKRLT